MSLNILNLNMATHNVKPKYTGIGTSQALNSRVEHLANLLRNLPETLPLNPDQSHYHFAADPADIEDLGLYGAFAHNLEICFEKFKSADEEIKLLECGDRFNVLVPFIKWVICKDPDCRDMVGTAWVEWLIQAARTAGAVIPEINARRTTMTLEHSGTGMVKKEKAIWNIPHAQTASAALQVSQPIILSPNSESDDELDEPIIISSASDSAESSETEVITYSANSQAAELVSKPRTHCELSSFILNKLKFLTILL